MLGLGGLVILSIALAAIGLAFLDSAPGKRWLTTFVNNQLEAEGIKISRLKGALYSELRSDEVIFSDEDGPYLRLQDMHISWKAIALIKTRLEIKTLTIEEAHLLRLPQGEDPKPTSSSAIKRPTLPKLPVDIAITGLAVPQIIIADDIWNVGATLSASAQSVYLGSHVASLDAVLTRLDDAEKDAISVELDYHETRGRLALALNISGASGGLITSVLSAQKDEDFSLRLKGDGPLDAWSGSLLTQLGERLQFDGTLATSGTRLSVQGKARQSGFLPAPYAALLEPETNLSLEADINNPDKLPLVLSATSPAGHIHLDGILAPENAENLALDYEISLDDPSRISELTDSISLKSASLKGTINGTVDALRLRGALHLESPALNDIGNAANITADITARRDGPAITASITSKADGIAINELGPFPVGLTVTARYNETDKKLTLDQVQATLPGAIVTSKGWLSLESEMLALEAGLVIKELGDLPYPLPATGALQAAIILEKQPIDGRLVFDITVDGTDMSADDETVNALLGPSPHMDLVAILEPDSQRLSVNKMSLDTMGLTLEAGGNAVLDGSAVALDYALRLHDLAQITGDIPLVVAGGFTLTGTLSGPADALTVTTESRIDQIDIQNVPLRNIHLTAEAKGLRDDTPSVTLGADAQSRFGPLHLEAQAMMAKDGAISLPAFLMSIGAARLDGALERSADGLITGAITGTSGSLAELAEGARTGIRGDLSLDARLDAENGIQRIRADIDANKLVLPMGNSELLEMESLHLTSDLQLTDDLPLGQAQLEMTDMRMGFTRLTQIVLTADGRQDTLRIKGQADGDWRGALALEGGLVWQVQDVGQALLSLDLDGTLFGQIIETPEPITTRMDEESWQLEPFRLTVANGHIDGHAGKEADRISVSLSLDSLPLELVNIMAPRLLPTGTLSAELAILQTGQAVEASLDAVLDNVAPAQAGFAQTPPMTAQLAARLADQRLTATGSATAKDALQADYTLDLPLRVDLLEGTFNLMEEEPLNGEVAWNGALAPLFMVFNLPRHEASGDLNADMILSGTMKDPQVNGTVALRDVRYEHLDSGFVATSLALDARLNNRRLVIESLTGADGNSGTLKGEGWAELTETGALLADIGLNLEGVTVTRRVDVTAVTSADLRLQLNEKDMRASGTLSPDRADVDIGRSVPSDIVTIEVVELRTTEDGNSMPAGKKDRPNDMPFLLDFKVDAPRRIFVRGRGLDSEWEAHLVIKGTANAPTLSGTAGLLKGSFDFAGRRFTLDGGQIIFTGARKIDPLLDIKAREQMNGHDVTLALSGPLSQPSISLSSSPPLPEDEILSRLLFGESVADLSPLQAVQLASALSTLSGGGGLDLVGATRSVLGLDRLNIDMPGDDAAGTRITGGKYLTDDVYFEVSTETGSGITRGTLEWSLTKSLSLRSRMSSSQDNSITLRWSWRY